MGEPKQPTANDITMGVALARVVLASIDADEYADLDGAAVALELPRDEEAVAWLVSATIQHLAGRVDELEAARATDAAEIAKLTTRRDELLALAARLTNEVPFPDEIKNWTAQRAALVAEVGTLKAKLAEAERDHDALRLAVTSIEGYTETRVAEQIAAWLVDEAKMIDAGANPYAPTDDVSVARSDALRSASDDIRAGSYRPATDASDQPEEVPMPRSG